MKTHRGLLRASLVAVALVFCTSTASAIWIRIEFKEYPDGGWSLFGTTYLHTRTVVCYSAGLGDPPPATTHSITLPDDTPLDQLALTELRLYAGPGSPPGGPGLAPLFDATMFPAPPGYQFDTGDGSEFRILFDTPRAFQEGTAMFELTDVLVSMQSDLWDSNSVLAEAKLANGATFDAGFTSIPEPATGTSVAWAAMVAISGYGTRRLFRRS